MTRYGEVHERLRQMTRLYYAAAIAWQSGDTDLAIPVRSAAAAIYGLLATDLMAAAGVAKGDDAGRLAATGDLATMVTAVRERAHLQAIEHACRQVPSASAAYDIARERLADVRAKMADASGAEATARRRIRDALTT
jgi:hypothetical protein